MNSFLERNRSGLEHCFIWLVRDLLASAAQAIGAGVGGLLLALPTLQAATVYVSMQGVDDTGRRGDPAYPFRTVTRAYQAARFGDTISIRPGDYLEHSFTGKGVRIVAPRGSVRMGWYPPEPPPICGCPPSNFAPVITLPSEITLSWLGSTVCTQLPAYVGDDGKPITPGRVVTLWQQEGPGPRVTFGDPARTNSLACFGSPGTYQLRLTAWDGYPADPLSGLSSTKTVTVNVVDFSRSYLARVYAGTCSSGSGSVVAPTSRYAIKNTHPSLAIQFKVEVIEPVSGSGGGGQVPGATVTNVYNATLKPGTSWPIPCGGKENILSSTFVASTPSLAYRGDDRNPALGAGTVAGAGGATAALSLIRSADQAAAESSVGLYLLGMPSVLYRIEVSTNLVIWTPLVHARGSEEPVRIQDVPDSEIGARFYRAVEETNR